MELTENEKQKEFVKHNNLSNTRLLNDLNFRVKKIKADIAKKVNRNDKRSLTFLAKNTFDRVLRVWDPSYGIVEHIAVSRGLEVPIRDFTPSLKLSEEKMTDLQSAFAPVNKSSVENLHEKISETAKTAKSEEYPSFSTSYQHLDKTQTQENSMAENSMAEIMMFSHWLQAIVSKQTINVESIGRLDLEVTNLQTRISAMEEALPNLVTKIDNIEKNKTEVAQTATLNPPSTTDNEKAFSALSVGVAEAVSLQGELDSGKVKVTAASRSAPIDKAVSVDVLNRHEDGIATRTLNLIKSYLNADMTVENLCTYSKWDIVSIPGITYSEVEKINIKLHKEFNCTLLQNTPEKSEVFKLLIEENNLEKMSQALIDAEAVLSSKVAGPTRTRLENNLVERIRAHGRKIVIKYMKQMLNEPGAMTDSHSFVVRLVDNEINKMVLKTNDRPVRRVQIPAAPAEAPQLL